MGSRGYLDYYIHSPWLVTTGSRVRVKFDAERRVSFVSEGTWNALHYSEYVKLVVSEFRRGVIS